MPKVTASKVHSLAKEPGRHNAGGSLYLVVKGGSEPAAEICTGR